LFIILSGISTRTRLVRLFSIFNGISTRTRMVRLFSILSGISTKTRRLGCLAFSVEYLQEQDGEVVQHPQWNIYKNKMGKVVEHS
jgi:hypothetical protein